jgi:hypothetical protein
MWDVEPDALSFHADRFGLLLLAEVGLADVFWMGLLFSLYWSL